MSNISKKHVFVYAASFSLVLSQFACSRTEKTETTTTSTTTTKEQAYDDYKGFVTTLESDVQRGWDTTATDADQRMEQWRTDYEAKRTALAQYEADLDADQRKEYDELQSRYNTAWTTREEQYNTWRMNHQGSGMAASGTTGSGSVDMTLYNESKIPSYTATDIRTAYEDFVRHVEANKAGFSNNDWNTVEKYWNQLDDRKNAIQGQLSDKDKWEIAKAKTKYVAIKNASKIGNTASKVGSDAKEVGKDVSNSKAGEATKDAGKAVGNTAKKAGQKVGEVFKDDKN